MLTPFSSLPGTAASRREILRLISSEFPFPCCPASAHTGVKLHGFSCGGLLAAAERVHILIGKPPVKRHEQRLMRVAILQARFLDAADDF